MKNNKSLLLLTIGAVMALTGCGTGDSGGTSSDHSTGGGDLTSSETSDDAGGGGGIVSDPGYSLAFDGIVRIYYHNDQNDYASKRLWIWANGVDGNVMGETPFTNQSSPDSYGIYYDLDLQTGPFAGVELASISFIVKEAGTWAGQSNDTLVPFAGYENYIEDIGNGRQRLTVYGIQGNGGNIECYATRNEALGDRIGSLYFEDWETLVVKGAGNDDGTRPAEEIGRVVDWRLYAYDGHYYFLVENERPYDPADYLVASGTANSNSFEIKLSGEVDPGLNYTLECNFAQNTGRFRTRSASFVNLYDTDKFQDEYVYDGNDLGYTVTPEGKSQYKLWAPTASRVQLFTYVLGETTEVNHLGVVDNTLNNHQTREMTREEKGVWTYTEDRTLPSRRFYTYYVTTSDGSQETIDPYAHAAGINGIRGYVMNDATWASEDAEPLGFDESIAKLSTDYAISAPNELSVYEAHIRDLTMDDTWRGENKPGTYLAFSESGTTYAEGGASVKTGFDHIVETGVNAVQLLPVFDQDNDERTITDGEGNVVSSPSYNWGYNPLNYNVVEGSYSSDPFEPVTRILEYKTLIKAFADKGIRIIMDVVYNHLASVGNNCFNKVIPDYFFRKNAEGGYIDGSGTGNVTASQRPMVRKYIVDSVVFWAEQYGIKGFRFDLMGCLDTETMRAVKDALYEVDPQIVVYGEGWDGSFGNPDGNGLKEPYLSANNSNVYSQLYDVGKGGVGCFNDAGRDGLKGNTQWDGGKPDWGFISKGANDLAPDGNGNTNQYLTDSVGQFLGANYRAPGANPAQTVNYVACHDNYTLYDQLNWVFGYDEGPTAEDRPEAIAATVALNAAVMMSQGIAFLNGGDEIFRQKILTPEDPYFALIESLQEDDPTNTDAIMLEDGNMLVRNSYNYGDECNSFKWDRKVKYYDEYLKTIEAIHYRAEMMGDLFGMQYAENIEGSDPDAWSWGNLGKYPNDYTAIAANFRSASGEHYYVMLGGRSEGETSNLAISNQSVEVVYSSSDYHEEGTTFSISNGSIGVGRFELLLLKAL